MVVVIAAPAKYLLLTLNFGHTAGWSSLGRPNSEQIREQLLHGRDNGGHLGHSVVTVSKVLTHSGPGTGDPPVGRFERKQLSRDRAEQNLRYKVSRTSGQWFLLKPGDNRSATDRILGGYLIVWLLKPPTSNTRGMPNIGITKI